MELKIFKILFIFLSFFTFLVTSRFVRNNNNTIIENDDEITELSLVKVKSDESSSEESKEFVETSTHSTLNSTALAASKTLRLPNTTYPLTYDIHLKTDVHAQKLEFQGKVSIDLIIVNETHEIILHAGNRLKILKVNLINLESEHEIDNVTYSYDNETTFLRIYSPIEERPLNLSVGKKYLLSISYSGKIEEESPFSFYKTVYNNDGVSDLWLGVSHFQPTYARDAFPCYDEPPFKSVFTLSITHGKNYSAISNMPALEEPIEIQGENDTITVTTRFHPTPKMSVYNFAFVVSNYEIMNSEIRNGVLHRVFAPPKSEYIGQFALNVSIGVYEGLTAHLNTSLPLKKIDHISVPERFGRGMENWGLIIYEDDWLLLKPNSSDFHRMSVAIVIAHELAHQWFGNLVTTKWWSYTWLNEGFATFYSYKILNQLYPEFKMEDYCKIWELDTTLEVFQYRGQIPITRYVEKREDIMGTFGHQSYATASFILRMFENAIGESTFQKGIIKYLHKFKYDVADEDDLFNCLQEQAIKDNSTLFKEPNSIAKIMKSWTHEAWFPIIFVERNYTDNEFLPIITLRQKSIIQYLNRTTSNEERNNTAKHLWWIPITFMTANQSDFDNLTVEFIFPNQTEITVNLTDFQKTLAPNDWLVLNKEFLGLYYVNYDEKNWKLIAKALKENPKCMPNHNKIHLLMSVHVLAQTKLIPRSTFMDVFLYLENELDPLPWKAATGILMEIYADLKFSNQTTDYFKYFGRTLIRNVFNDIGLLRKDTDQPFSSDLRLDISRVACFFELKDCLEKSYEIFKEVFLYGNTTFKLSRTEKYFIFDVGLQVSAMYEEEELFKNVSVNDI